MTSLTMQSGLLSFDLSLLPILPAGCPQPIGLLSRLHGPDIYVLGHHHFTNHFILDQTHEAIQAFRRRWIDHIRRRTWTYARLPNRKSINTYDPNDPDRRRYRRWNAQRTCSARRASVSKKSLLRLPYS